MLSDYPIIFSCSVHYLFGCAIPIQEQSMVCMINESVYYAVSYCELARYYTCNVWRSGLASI